MKKLGVVHTRPHQESRAELNLKRQGFIPWLPKTKRARRRARRIDTIFEPLFPGYLFVEIDPAKDDWAPINNTYGVKYLITDGKLPKFLPMEFEESIRLVDAEETETVYSTFDVRPGQRVKFVAGPFVDSIALVRKMLPKDRVKLLIEVLGGNVMATVPRRDVLPATL